MARDKAPRLRKTPIVTPFSDSGESCETKVVKQGTTIADAKSYHQTN